MKDNLYSHKTVFFKILLFGALFAVLHIALERGLSYAASDVSLTALVRPLNVAIILCDAASFFLLYALVLTSASLFGTKRSTASFLLLIALTLFKHLANWMIFLVTENVTSAINIRLSALTAASSIFIELLQHALVIVCILILFRKPSEKEPTKIATFAICGVMLAVNLISRVITDIDYGAPSSAAEIWVMVAYYLFDILLYVGGAYIVMQQIQKRERKKCPAID